jgi:hypothetical protein
LESHIFDLGSLWLDGRADFLAVPHVAVKAQLGIENLALNYVRPVARHYDIDLRSGTVSGMGVIEYAPTLKVVHLRHADILGLQMDYYHTAQSARAEQEKAIQVRQAAQNVNNAPGIRLRIDQVSVVKSEVGLVNKAANPNYRVFLADTEVHLTNFSNQLEEGPMVAKVTGKFMGSGRTMVGATFRPETNGPYFALAASVENTQMRAMNNLLRAHAKIDAVQGFFSVYSELRVQNGVVRGYVKPLFKDMDVHDPRQDKEKGLFQRIYEGLVGGASQLLENIPRDEVATKTQISGRLEDPQASTWQALSNLIQNAFFKAILPGFEQELGRSKR